VDELVKLVASKTGIPEATARQAAEVVLNFLKERLPEQIASRLDAVVEHGDKIDDLGNIAGGIGKMFR
jgi:uncharacterized protein (DUF2267 family)